MVSPMDQIFPLLYGACFLLLLVQAFQVMARGFMAVPRPGDGVGSNNLPSPSPEDADRTGRLTIHPELIDSDGQLIRDDLMTVRFSSESEGSAVPPDSN
ncbi:MAG: DUF2973 domain-containing protein [Cyanobacteria bacterium]|nr:DUF2973 domain-containing protein [Cyanobacteria bacterium bin.51]